MHYSKKEEDKSYSIKDLIKLTSLITTAQDFDKSKNIRFLILFTFDLYKSFGLWWWDKIWTWNFSTILPPFCSDWMKSGSIIKKLRRRLIDFITSQCCYTSNRAILGWAEMCKHISCHLADSNVVMLTCAGQHGNVCVHQVAWYVFTLLSSAENGSVKVKDKIRQWTVPFDFFQKSNC